MVELGAALMLQPYVGVKNAAWLMMKGLAVPLAEKLILAHSDGSSWAAS